MYFFFTIRIVSDFRKFFEQQILLPCHIVRWTLKHTSICIVGIEPRTTVSCVSPGGLITVTVDVWWAACQLSNYQLAIQTTPSLHGLAAIRRGKYIPANHHQGARPHWPESFYLRHISALNIQTPSHSHTAGRLSKRQVCFSSLSRPRFEFWQGQILFTSPARHWFELQQVQGRLYSLSRLRFDFRRGQGQCSTLGPKMLGPNEVSYLMEFRGLFPRE